MAFHQHTVESAPLPGTDIVLVERAELGLGASSTMPKKDDKKGGKGGAATPPTRAQIFEVRRSLTTGVATTTPTVLTTATAGATAHRMRTNEP